MNVIKLILSFTFVILIIGCSSESNFVTTPEDDPIPEIELITGKATYYELGDPVNNATVFYGNTLLTSDHYFTHLTNTNSKGNYSIDISDVFFDYITIYSFNNEIKTYYISPVIKIEVDHLENNLIPDDLVMFEQNNESNVTGVLIDDEWDEIQYNVSNNLVYLYHLESISYIKIDSTYSDSLGCFEFSDLATSNYCIRPIPIIERSVNRAFFFVDGLNDIEIEIVYGVQLP